MSCEGLWVFKFLFYQGTCVCNRVGCISLFVVILEWALKYVKKKKRGPNIVIGANVKHEILEFWQECPPPP